MSGGGENLGGRLALSIAETAAVLGVGKRTVERAVAERALPHVRFGRRRVLIPVAAVEQLIAEAVERAAAGATGSER